MSASARAHDEAARRLAQTEFRHPVVLEAGAGTGKTSTLVARVIAWTLGPGWAEAERRLATQDPVGAASLDAVAARVLDGVVAITFTEAAAAEMAERLGHGYTDIERGNLPKGVLDDALPEHPELRIRRARALLGALDRVVVCTIHAFCRRLLTAHPLEAGLHPYFQLDPDGAEITNVVREVVEAKLKTAYAEPGDPEFLSLAEQGIGPQEIANALEALAGDAVPDAVFDADPFSPERVGALLGQIIEHASLLGELVQPRVASNKKLSKARGVAERLLALAARLSEPAHLALDEIQSAASALEGDLSKLGEWSKGGKAGSELELLADAMPEISRSAGILRPLLQHLPKLDEERTQRARGVLRPLLREVNRQLVARGIMSFQALLVRARDLLVSRPDVAASLRRGIRQLLVDEFQDTDRVQCDVVAALSLDGPADARPGLFLVGDPKQSIYGWRGAELAAYFGFRERVEQLGGLVRSLTVNFRSVPSILEEVGHAMAPIMHARAGVQAPYEALLPSLDKEGDPGFAQGLWAPTEYWISWSADPSGRGPATKTNADEAVRIEADALAADLLRLRREHQVRWRDVALLLRAATSLDRYLSALRDANIPYAVERDRSYFRRREVIDASALVRAVLDPNDHLALITLLRSPIVGVPDAALLPLWRRQFPQLITDLVRPDPERLTKLAEVVREAASNMPRDVPGLERVAGWEHSLVATTAWLADLRDAFENEPADLFVERMRALFHLEATEAARHLGKYRLANLDRLFRTLLVALDDGGGDPQAILRALRNNISQSREGEEGRPKETAGDAVRVMTMHKAKGLDFGHVYVMGLHAKSDRRDRGVEEAQQVDTADGPVWEYRVFGLPTPGWYRVDEQRRLVEEHERVRLLYVAMTRARVRLVLSGNFPEPSREGPGDRAASSHAELLLRRATGVPDLRHAMTELHETAVGARWDANATAWIFPSLLPKAGEVLADRPDEWTSLARAREHGLWLDARRVEAKAHADRPLGSAASKEAHAFLRAAVADRRFGEEGSPEEGVGASMVPGSEPLGEEERLELAVGSAIHRVLETLPLDGYRETELSRSRGRLRAFLRTLLGGTGMDKALRRAERILDRIEAGLLIDHLRDLGPAVLARELPVLLPAGSADSDAVAYVAGAVDMVYRDPADGQIVVVDYKADVLEPGSAEVEARARAYARQGAFYRRAVEDALGCPARLELWFLWPDEIWEIPADEAASPLQRDWR